MTLGNGGLQGVRHASKVSLVRVLHFIADKQKQTLLKNVVVVEEMTYVKS